jgi:hypothetical protein
VVITAYNATQTFALGSLAIDPPYFVPDEGKFFDVLEGVKNDVFGLTPVGISDYYWSIKWALFLWSYETQISPSLFISALPKYNLGIVAYSYEGFCSGEQYWNFTSQRFRDNICSTLLQDGSYPQEGPFPNVIGEGNIVLIYAEDAPYSANYATGAYIRLQSAPSAGMLATVLYTVGANEKDSTYVVADF